MTNIGSSTQAPVGHNRVFKTLAHAISSGTVHHAYLFEGIRGIGKLETAAWFARGLLCENHQAAKAADSSGGVEIACGQCGACMSLQRAQHPDILEVAPPEGSSQIRVDQVREIIQRVRYAPLRGVRRVIVLHQADRLGEVAANALLKTLEEPAPYNVFVLLTDRAQSLLPTILSRCQGVRFAPLARSVVAKALVEQGLDMPQSQVLAAASGGSLGMARTLNDAGFLESSGYWLDRYLNPRGPSAADMGDVISDAAELAQAFRKNPDPDTSGVALLFTSMRLGLRDIILHESGLDSGRLTWPERDSVVADLRERVPLARILGLVEHINEAEAIFHRPLNPTLVVEDALLRVVTAIRA